MDKLGETTEKRESAPILEPLHRLIREGKPMELYYITFRSVTFAQRGERRLNRAGFLCHLGRTPRWMEEQGCGYALTFRGGDPEGAVALLRREQIPLRRVYRQREDGNMEVLSL